MLLACFDYDDEYWSADFQSDLPTCKIKKNQSHNVLDSNAVLLIFQKYTEIYIQVLPLLSYWSSQTTPLPFSSCVGDIFRPASTTTYMADC